MSSRAHLSHQGSLLTKYQCYHPRDYVFRARCWPVYIGCGATGCSREPSGDREPSCTDEVRPEIVARGGGGGLAKRVVARKARSNDVCLALKERVCVGGVEDTGFGTGMMGEGRGRPYPWSLSSLVETLSAASSFGSSSLLRSLTLPLFIYLSFSLSYLHLAICRFYCRISVTPSSFSHLSPWSRSSPRKLKLPCVGVRASGAP